MSRKIKLVETGFQDHAAAMRKADAMYADGLATPHIYAERKGDAGWCLYDVAEGEA